MLELDRRAPRDAKPATTLTLPSGIDQREMAPSWSTPKSSVGLENASATIRFPAMGSGSKP